jgi:CDP-glycerol glycerophosphotransferase (TagB/SpsB family)
MDPSLKFVNICHRIGPGLLSKFNYFMALAESIRELSRCKVCVLDAYWPAVSILPHREDQTVIQLWHAAGKIKRSGYSSLGKPDGRDQKVAEILCMHKNYDWIIAGNPRWNQFYCESFNVDRSKLKCLGLPRFDSLLRYEAPMRHRIMRRYPQIKKKHLILYVPTFRRTPSDRWKELIGRLDKEAYTVVVKAHPNQPLEKIEGTLDMPEFSSRQLLTAAEYVITDYSSIALEAAALNRKTFYYLYDYETYVKNNGVNINLEKEMPGCVFYDAESLIQAIESGRYNQEALKTYREHNLPINLGYSAPSVSSSSRRTEEHHRWLTATCVWGPARSEPLIISGPAECLSKST